MNEEWTTWILIPPGGADDVSEARIRTLGRYAHVDLSERPSAALDVHQGRPILLASDLAKFFQRCSRDTGLLAFSCAPLADLQRIHRTTFYHAAHWYTCTWLGVDMASEPDPYRLRMVRFDRGGVRAASNLEGAEGECHETAPESFPPERDLFLAPARFTLTEMELSEFIERSARVLDQLNLTMLPPWDLATDAVYFTSDRLRVRNRFWSDPDDTDEPAAPLAVSVQRWIDDPTVRPALAEGGSFRIDHRDGVPTGITLELCSATSVGAYRSRFLGVMGTAMSSPMAGIVGTAIRRDIVERTHPRLAFSLRDEARSWEVDEFDFEAPGSDDRLPKRLGALTEALDASDRSRFNRRVLLPAHRAGRFDPAAATQRFTANYMAAPDPDLLDDQSWRYTVDVILSLFEQPPGEVDLLSSCEDVIRSWPGLGVDATTRRAWDIACDPSVDASSMMRLRLLAPADSIVRKRGEVSLDESTILDRSFRLG